MNWETLEKDLNLLIHQMETIKDGDSPAQPDFWLSLFLLHHLHLEAVVRQETLHPQAGTGPGGLADNK